MVSKTSKPEFVKARKVSLSSQGMWLQLMLCVIYLLFVKKKDFHTFSHHPGKDFYLAYKYRVSHRFGSTLQLNLQFLKPHISKSKTVF